MFLQYMMIQCMKVVLHHQLHLLKLNPKQGIVSLDLKLKNCGGHPFGPHVEQLRKFIPTRKFRLMWRCEEVSELKFSLSFCRGAWQRSGCVCTFPTFHPFLVLWMLCSGGNIFQIHADPVNVQTTVFSFIMVRGQLIRMCARFSLGSVHQVFEVVP